MYTNNYSNVAQQLSLFTFNKKNFTTFPPYRTLGWGVEVPSRHNLPPPPIIYLPLVHAPAHCAQLNRAKPIAWAVFHFQLQVVIQFQAWHGGVPPPSTPYRLLVHIAVRVSLTSDIRLTLFDCPLIEFN